MPAAKRQAVAHLVEYHGMSERRACWVIGCCRITMRYEVVRRDDSVLRERLKEVAKPRSPVRLSAAACFLLARRL